LHVIVAASGAVILFDQTESFWIAFAVLLVAAGLTAFRDRSAERLDALVEFLDGTGQLDPNIERPARGSA
jgi:hypothetical protein